jgi:TRAP-type C4-dicarboxylate transport system permease small subunit
VTFSGLYRGFERLTLALAVFSALLILAMSFWITYDVITRYFLDFASPWSFDLSEYSLVWITFLGAPWVLMQDRHVRIELLVDVLPVRFQRLLGIAVCVVAIFICAVLAWRTGVAAIEYYERNVMMARIWRIPRIWPYFVIPLGSGLLSVVFVLRLGLYLKDPDPEARLRARASAGQESGLASVEAPSHGV